MTKGEIVQAIFALPFYSEETARHFTVIMGGACVLLGLREETDDVDMACDGQYFEDLRAVGYPVLLSRHGREKMQFGKVSVYKGWQTGERVCIEGLFVQGIDGLYRDKLRFSRPKDLRDLCAIPSATEDCVEGFRVYSHPNYLRGSLHKGWRKTPVLMVHGYFSSNKIGPHRLYYQLAAELQQLGYSVLRIDLSAMGESDGRIEETTFQKHVADVYAAAKRLMEACKSDTIHLIGHCAGCYAAIEALAALETVKTVTLISPMIAGDEEFATLLGRENYQKVLREGFAYRKGLYCDKSFIDAAYCLFREETLEKAKAANALFVFSGNDEFSPFEKSRAWAQEKGFSFISVEGADHNYLDGKARASLFEALRKRFAQEE